MAPPRHTRVDRAVDRDAIPGQRATRDDEVLKTGTRRRLQRSLRSRGGYSLRYHEVVGRRIRRVRGASESENHRCENTNFFHTATPEYDRSRSCAKPYIATIVLGKSLSCADVIKT